jgi:phage-related protein
LSRHGAAVFRLYKIWDNGVKPVIWLGDSLSRLREFAPEGRREAGHQLRRVQEGADPADWKPMSLVGLGVNEIRVRVGGAYRVIYVAKYSDAIYVLHAFQKKSRKTARLDIEMARLRFRRLVLERGER